MSNYPPGVTGREYEIAGPDFEQERDIACPNGHSPSMVYGYEWETWAHCFDKDCTYFIEGKVSYDPLIDRGEDSYAESAEEEYEATMMSEWQHND